MHTRTHVHFYTLTNPPFLSHNLIRKNRHKFCGAFFWRQDKKLHTLTHLQILFCFHTVSCKRIVEIFTKKTSLPYVRVAPRQKAIRDCNTLQHTRLQSSISLPCVMASRQKAIRDYNTLLHTYTFSIIYIPAVRLGGAKTEIQSLLRHAATHTRLLSSISLP